METSSLGDIPMEIPNQEAGKTGSLNSKKGAFATVKEKVNRDLLIPKLSFFFYFMAIGAFLPYLGVFYKQLWITARESGILLGIRPFIKTLVSPLWGMVADVFNRPKLILLISIFGCLVGYFSQSVVSPFELPCYKGSYEEYMANVTGLVQNSSKRDFITFPRGEKGLTLDSKDPVSVKPHFADVVDSATVSEKETKSVNINELRTPGGTLNFMKAMNEDGGRESKLPRVNLNSARDKNNGRTQEVLRRVKRIDTEIDQFPSRTKTRLRQPEAGRQSGSISELEKDAFSKNGEDLKALFEEDSKSQAQDGSKKRFLTSVSKPESRPKPRDDFRVKNNKEIFITLLVIVILGEFIASPAPLLADMGTLALLRGQEHEYGHQRLFGSFGWGLGSLITGAAVTYFNHCPYSDSINYLPSFYVFAAAMFCNLIVSIFFKFETNPHPVSSPNEPSFLQGLRLFCSVKNGSFIFVLFFFGLSHSLQLSFLFWFLQDIGGTPLLFTTIVLMNSIGEVIMFFCATYIVAKVGNDAVLYFGLICYGVRFLFYSYVENPWLVLPLEFIQGITYGGVWTASVAYVGQQPGESSI